MTNEKYEEARMLKERIAHITQVIDLLNSREYTCEPPIRNTSIEITRGPLRVNVNEGEAKFILAALRTERERLQDEFEKL